MVRGWFYFERINPSVITSISTSSESITPPAEEISEEERIRKIDEKAEAKNVEKRQKSVQRYRERHNNLKAAAQAVDPEAVAKLESERE